MESNQMKALIESFKGYRDLLAPIQKNLADFTNTYDSMRENVEKLNASFGGDLKAKLEEIFKQMSGQAGKAADLSGRIDQLAKSAHTYASEVGSMVALFSKIEERLGAVLDIEGRAEAQIARLDTLLEEKTKSYNLKELQSALESYNRDVKKVSEFINKDVADTLMGSRETLDAIKGGIDQLVKARTDENASLEKLMQSYGASEQFLQKLIEKEDVNEAYLFEILDRWAETRRVKIKN
ncbi:MAG: hypothetical protein FWH03_05955 [Firmicutes bacterium]|nr:hypothetical protein [Bacillota bacterium]